MDRLQTKDTPRPAQEDSASKSAGEVDVLMPDYTPKKTAIWTPARFAGDICVCTVIV